MNKRKLGALIATIALIAAIAIGGTLAYFTDKDENTNVVKMGHVDITLTETSNSDKATVIDEKGITFENVLPGDTLSKVPTIAVENGSADCYVRVQLDHPGRPGPAQGFSHCPDHGRRHLGLQRGR